ncbi:MAG: hypothetical protein ACTSWQ_01515 [Candidatus Thorarchaeota archaeon]
MVERKIMMEDIKLLTLFEREEQGYQRPINRRKWKSEMLPYEHSYSRFRRWEYVRYEREIRKLKELLMSYNQQDIQEIEYKIRELDLQRNWDLSFVLVTEHRDEVLELMTELYDRGYRYRQNLRNRIEMTKSFCKRRVRVAFRRWGYEVHLDRVIFSQPENGKYNTEETGFSVLADFSTLRDPQSPAIQELIEFREYFANPRIAENNLRDNFKKLLPISWQQWAELWADEIQRKERKRIQLRSREQ